MKISVAIPTYRRPEYLWRAAQSVLSQSPPPHELILVSRVDDRPTNDRIAQLISEHEGATQIVHIHVQEAGFLPPVRAAVARAMGEIFVLLDDDAVAHHGWLSKISLHYEDPAVGGVGGRCVNFAEGVLQKYPPVKTVARLYWYGRSIGNMYCDCLFDKAVEADFLMGGNLSYRTAILRRCLPDARLGRNVSFHWEMDVGLQVKKLGFRVLFDPMIMVDHHSAPREISGMRSVNYDGMYWSNFNYALLMRKHLTKTGFAAYLLYSFIVGWTGSPGFIYVLYCILRGKHLPWRDSIGASIRGRVSGSVAA